MRLSFISQTISVVAGSSLLITFSPGCKSPEKHRREADEAAYKIIQQKQQEAVGKNEPLSVETPADTLRRRLLLDQNLQYSSDASLGTRALKPIPHWPKDNYLNETVPPYPDTPVVDVAPLRITLLDALKIAAHNSREYQTQKEQVFTTALGLDLERDAFRANFAAAISGNALVQQTDNGSVSGVSATPEVGVSQRLKNGMLLSTSLALDLVKLLTDPEQAAYGIISDSSISIPLLRGAGQHIVTEPLTQAERDVVYAILDFEQFKKQFSVNIATQYFQVLQQFDQAQNAEDSYRRVILTARRSRRLSDAGRLPPIQLDQAVQNELRSRDQWIRSQQSLQRSIDNFKLLLGLPTDALIDFDRTELQRLIAAAEPVLRAAREAAGSTEPYSPTTQPSSSQLPAPNVSEPGATRPAETRPTTEQAEIELIPPSREGAGRMEIEEDQAIAIAFGNRPDLRVIQGAIYDAQRKVVVAADALQAGLSLNARALFGEGRSIGGLQQPDVPDAQLRLDRHTYTGGLLLDLPLERTFERNVYRNSLINLERSTRNLQDFEDRIKADVRDDLRTLLQQREALINQTKQVQVAERRVASNTRFFEAGRAQVRDLLEAQDALVSAQNNFTNALVSYRVAELELQRDLGVLEVNTDGVWQEFDPAAAAKAAADAAAASNAGNAGAAAGMPDAARNLGVADPNRTNVGPTVIEPTTSDVRVGNPTTRPAIRGLETAQ